MPARTDTPGTLRSLTRVHGHQIDSFVRSSRLFNLVGETNDLVLIGIHELVA